MNQKEKFLFDENFDSEVVEQVGAAKKEKAPTFSEAELTEAEQRGFEAGRGAALQEAKGSAEERIAESLDALAGQIEELADQAARSQAQHQRATLDFACQAIGKLFPALARQGALQEAERVVESCLMRLRSEPRIVLRTADGLHDLLRDRIEDVAGRAGFEGRIVLLTEDNMGPSDIRVEWADGGAERNTAGLWSEIEEIVARSLIGTGFPPDAETHGAAAQETDPEPTLETTEPTVQAQTDPELGQVGASA